MTLPITALTDASAIHLNGFGSLELRTKSKQSAKFFFERGMIYAITINDFEPPLLERLALSIDKTFDYEEVLSLASRIPASALKFALLQHQLVPQKLIDDASRDFFLYMAEQVLSTWGDVKTSWKNDDHLPAETGYSAPLIEVTKMRDVLARRESNILAFASGIGVDISEVYNVQIHPSKGNHHDVIAETDAEQLVLNNLVEHHTLDNQSRQPTLSRLAARGACISPATIAKGVFTLWQNDIVRLEIDGEEISNPYVPQEVAFNMPESTPLTVDNIESLEVDFAPQGTYDDSTLEDEEDTLFEVTLSPTNQIATETETETETEEEETLPLLEDNDTDIQNMVEEEGEMNMALNDTWDEDREEDLDTNIETSDTEDFLNAELTIGETRSPNVVQEFEDEEEENSKFVASEVESQIPASISSPPDDFDDDEDDDDPIAALLEQLRAATENLRTQFSEEVNNTSNLQRVREDLLEQIEKLNTVLQETEQQIVVSQSKVRKLKQKLEKLSL